MRILGLDSFPLPPAGGGEGGGGRHNQAVRHGEGGARAHPLTPARLREGEQRRYPLGFQVAKRQRYNITAPTTHAVAAGPTYLSISRKF